MPTYDETPAIVCLAHLGWDFVWQRPQHILSRLARHYPTLYIHEPQIHPSSYGQPYLRPVDSEGGVTAFEPRYPDRRDVLEAWREVYVGLIRDALLERGWLRRGAGGLTATRPLIAWFYTPLPVYVLDQLPVFDVVVYDIMDDLASFKGASPTLREREAQLMQRADVVFAGGRSMYEARQGRHPNLHLYASGVDPTHFAQALSPLTEAAPEIRDLPRPRFGYYGVIDERIDYDLLAYAATARPDWSFIMVGPFAKVDPATLPHPPNLHYPGQQPYDQLPQFLKGFDVCLMPFAMNEATRSISPTKTLEYMAAHKPIVSTPVPDVVANWSDVVSIADTPDGFVAALEAALAESVAERDGRIARQQAVLARHTWDHIVAQMRGHIDQAILRRQVWATPRVTTAAR